MYSFYIIFQTTYTQAHTYLWVENKKQQNITVDLSGKEQVSAGVANWGHNRPQATWFQHQDIIQNCADTFSPISWCPSTDKKK